MGRRAIITGGAGFIGSHLVDLLLEEGTWKVTVIDDLGSNSQRTAKEANLRRHRKNPALELIDGNIMDDAALDRAFSGRQGLDTVVIHLAAKVGVRPSLLDPVGYHRVNTTGTLRVLGKAQAAGATHFLLASSSSVYGENKDLPWIETATGLRPMSPYSASKLAAEQFLQCHSRLHGMKASVLRFFTVYGPRQRPDLAIHKFHECILAGTPIEQFGDGSSSRDYTYVTDIVRGVRSAIDRKVGEAAEEGLFEIFNLGNSGSVRLDDLIAAMEKELGRKAIILKRPDQQGDVPHTFADIGKARRALGYSPLTSLTEGLANYRHWKNALEGRLA